MSEFLPPDADRAKKYEIDNLWQLKLLLQDGSVVDAVPTTEGIGSAKYPYSLRYDDTADPICYLGEAVPGSLESDAVWRIKKIDFTGGASITFANGTATFVNKWSERAILSYS